MSILSFYCVYRVKTKGIYHNYIWFTLGCLRVRRPFLGFIFWCNPCSSLDPHRSTGNNPPSASLRSWWSVPKTTWKVINPEYPIGSMWRLYISLHLVDSYIMVHVFLVNIPVPWMLWVLVLDLVKGCSKHYLHISLAGCPFRLSL